LSKALLTFIAPLAASIKEEINYPGRPELRKRLAALAKSARLIEQELADPAILSLLLGDDLACITNEWQLDAGLHDIAERADAARGKVPQGQGRHKHYPRPEGLSSREICALIVTVAWKQARNKWPGVKNVKARRACQELWGAAGGNVVRQGGRSVEVWRDHMRSAKLHRDGPQANAFREDLIGG
jgi:hypothetical protein